MNDRESIKGHLLIWAVRFLQLIVLNILGGFLTLAIAMFTISFSNHLVGKG